MLLTFYILTFIVEQIFFKILTFKTGFDISLIYITLFSISCGIVFTVICKLFKEKTNKLLTYIFISFICVISAAQFIYYCIYCAPFSFYSLTEGGTGQALDFMPTIFNLMEKNPGFLLFFIPIIALVILSKFKKISFTKTKFKENIIYIYIAIIVFVGTIALVNIDTKEIDSSYDIYYNSNNLILQYNKFGFVMGNMLDLKDYLFYSPLYLEKTDSQAKLYSLIDKETYNVYTLNLNEDSTITKKDTIQKIDEYISTIEATKKNKYTGSFQNKNLILILGESYADVVVDKTLTPTLYKLSQEGMNFTNFYAPLFPVSTSDGEYMSLTGLIPAAGTWSLKTSFDKTMAFNTAKLAKNAGYKTYAYHDHSKEYFSRDKSIPNLGFDSFIACPDLKIDCNAWPESDEEMILATTADYIKSNQEKFLTYYITVSGHLPYTMSSATVLKNWDAVKNLKYSDKAKQYLASQIELDNALKKLIDALEVAKIAEDTVIAIYPDHYPYGLTLDEINELSSYTKDLKFGIHKSSFIIWHKGIKPQKIDTLCSNIDIMPTLANLFGFNYDSRMIIGRDIFSESEKIVIFSDQSFITDKIKYDSLKNTYVNLTTDVVNSESIVKIKKEVSNKFRISTAILNSDYYSTIFNDK